MLFIRAKYSMQISGAGGGGIQLYLFDQQIVLKQFHLCKTNFMLQCHGVVACSLEFCFVYYCVLVQFHRLWFMLVTWDWITCLVLQLNRVVNNRRNKLNEIRYILFNVLCSVCEGVQEWERQYSFPLDCMSFIVVDYYHI